MALHAMKNSAEGKDRPVFVHFDTPNKNDVKPDHINVDLTTIAKNLGIPQFNYDAFKKAYDTEPQIADLVDDFNSEGLVINKTGVDDSEEPDRDPADSRNRVAQMAKSATDLSD